MVAVLALAKPDLAACAVNVACIGSMRSPGFAHCARSRSKLPIDRLDLLLLDCCRLLHSVDLLPAFLRHPNTSVLESTRLAVAVSCVRAGTPLEPA
jgi:hypothetical protein